MGPDKNLGKKEKVNDNRNEKISQATSNLDWKILKCKS